MAATLTAVLPLALSPSADGHETVHDWVAQRDARLVEAALREPDRFRELVVLHQDVVYATAYRLLGHDGDAHDVSQEAFLRAYRALGRFADGRRFSPWICTITANVARDLLRDPIRRWIGFTGAASERAASRGSGPEEQLVAREQHDELGCALRKLKPALREVVVLRHVSGLSTNEVAQALGISESAAKMRLKRGLDALEKLLPHAGSL
ncbi:MAG: RNA polymerase sigma factor [Myxococcota bacterium]